MHRRPPTTSRTAVLSSFASVASLRASCLLCSFALVACGGKTTDDAPAVIVPQDSGGDAGFDTLPPPHDTTPRDTGPEVDRGTPSDVYPAFPVDMPRIVNNGGHVMTSPTIVTVTWDGDSQRSKFEAFGDAIGGTKYWKALVEEYGVGPATSGAANHVHVAAPFPSTGWTTDDAAQFVNKQLSDVATSKWPAPADDNVYVLYLPPGSHLDYNGRNACSAIGGYHTSVGVGASNVAYAVIPYCHSWGGSYFDSMTTAASHELDEAVTDPQPNVGPGYVGYDPAHLGWEIFQLLATETGDSCELYQDSYLRIAETGFDYSVQRQWSNAAAKAGRDPCVPASTDPYFTVVPLGTESITVNMSSYGGSSRTLTKGFHVAVGETRQIEVGFISEAATSGDWTIDPQEGTPIPGFGGGDTGHLDLRVIGPDTGRNGNKATIQVTVNSAGKIKGELMTIVSTDGAGATHYTPVLIGST